MAEPVREVLRASGITVRFGGVTALDRVDLVVAEGSIAALIGPNGAGKTTLLNAVTGMVSVEEGRVEVDGRDSTGLSPHERARGGVVRTFQNLEVFSNMTVLENVMTGAHRRTPYGLFDAVLRTPRYRRVERACRDQAMDKLAFVGLADKSSLPAGSLPYGSQRLLEMARALAAEPRLLLLDEPAAGLNNRETRGLGEIIRRIQGELAISVALVEHDMELVMDVCDAITVLSFGRVIATGTPLEIQTNPEVVAAYLGEED